MGNIIDNSRPIEGLGGIMQWQGFMTRDVQTRADTCRHEQLVKQAASCHIVGVLSKSSVTLPNMDKKISLFEVNKFLLGLYCFLASPV